MDEIDRIAVAEKKIFDHFELSPISRVIKTRHCHCDIYTVEFPAAEPTDNVPLLLLHGFGTGVAYWAPNCAALSRHQTVYCIDLPGFGRSSRPAFSSNETLAELQLVSTLEDWRKAMGIERVLLIAHSFGAYFASSYALEHPHRVAHLILVDPWGFAEKPVLTQKQIDPQLYMHVIASILSYFNPLFLLRCAGTFAAAALKMLRPDVGGKYTRDGSIYEYLASCNSRSPTGETLYKTLTNGSGFAKRPMSKRFYGLDNSIRSTFIYGNKTFIDPGPAFDFQFQRLETVTVQILRGAGHLVNVDVVDDFNQLIFSILDEVNGRQREERQRKEEEDGNLTD